MCHLQETEVIFWLSDWNALRSVNERRETAMQYPQGENVTLLLSEKKL